MQHFKRVAAWVLLIFMAAAAVLTFRPAGNKETLSIPDGRCVLFWHAKQRCPPCRKMESLLRRAMQDYPDFHLITLEYDIFANQPFARRFNVGTATIILLECRDGQNNRVRDLTAEVWQNLMDESGFLEMLRKELDEFDR